LKKGGCNVSNRLDTSLHTSTIKLMPQKRSEERHKVDSLN